MNIYLAGPLFTTGERNFNRDLAGTLSGTGFDIFLPQKECMGLTVPEDIFRKCCEGLMGADIVIAVLDGSDADSGTAWETGYAYAKGIPVIGVRTDFRLQGDDKGLNLMLSRSCTQLIEHSSLEDISPAAIAEDIARRIKNL
ncbi:MAG TPA: nucleoside 2-deoxyribosyltransferase [Spirochaetota bacterium]|nr:nucleoside 2-deoxyribosyltransferase [Spirochaetota bacterium]